MTLITVTKQQFGSEASAAGALGVFWGSGLSWSDDDTGKSPKNALATGRREVQKDRASMKLSRFNLQGPDSRVMSQAPKQQGN